jgi:hypothetical protein
MIPVDVVIDHGVQVCDDREIAQQHVEEIVVCLLESLQMLAQSEKTVRVETKYKEAKVFEILGSHPAIVASLFVKFGAATWEASVTNSGGSCTGGKGLCEQHSSVAEEVVHVQYPDVVVAEDGGFDWMACLAPFVCWNWEDIEAARMVKDWARGRMMDTFRLDRRIVGLLERLPLLWRRDFRKGGTILLVHALL